MQTNSKENEKLKIAFKKSAVEIIDEITNNDVKMYRTMLQKLLLGWMSTPVDLDPEERLSMVILWEDLDQSLIKIQKLQHETDVEFYKKSIS